MGITVYAKELRRCVVNQHIYTQRKPVCSILIRYKICSRCLRKITGTHFRENGQEWLRGFKETEQWVSWASYGKA